MCYNILNNVNYRGILYYQINIYFLALNIMGWRGKEAMDTEYYRNFMAMVDAGNMTSAAEYLHVTQPTLSKQLQLLEKRFETKLVVVARGRRRLHLTEAGEIFYQRAKEICALEDLAGDEMATATREVRGTLHFSISPGRSPRFIHRVLAGFHKEYPNVRFELKEGSTSVQQEDLLAGETDLGVCHTTLPQSEQFEFLFTCAETLTLVGAEDLLRQVPMQGARFSDLRGMAIATSGSGAAILRQEIGDPQTLFQLVAVCTTKASALAWARTENVAALIPAEEEEEFWPGLDSRKLSGVTLKKAIVRPRNRPLSHTAQVFLHYYESVLKAEKVDASVSANVDDTLASVLV